MKAFLDACRAILGDTNVVTDDEVKAGYLEEPRKLYYGKALAVLRPGSTAEVADIVKRCREFGVAIVPQGGNTGLVGGQIPDASGRQVVLSLKRMRAVREVDLASDTMIIEAGATLAEAQAAAVAHDRLYPLSLASEGTCTVGGNVSTNAGGVAVLSYGNTRELTRGVEVVLADGTVLNGLSKLRKDNTGYDLKDLFVGAEGTLGIVTAVALKLFPTPRAQATAFVGLESAEKALELLSLAKRRFAQEVTSFELLPRICLDFEFRHVQGVREPLAGKHAWYVLIEISSVAARRSQRRRGGVFRGGAGAGPDRGREPCGFARAAQRLLAHSRDDAGHADERGRVAETRRLRRRRRRAGALHPGRRGG